MMRLFNKMKLPNRETSDGERTIPESVRLIKRRGLGSAAIRPVAEIELGLLEFCFSITASYFKGNRHSVREGMFSV